MSSGLLVVRFRWIYLLLMLFMALGYQRCAASWTCKASSSRFFLDADQWVSSRSCLPFHGYHMKTIIWLLVEYKKEEICKLNVCVLIRQRCFSGCSSISGDPIILIDKPWNQDFGWWYRVDMRNQDLSCIRTWWWWLWWWTWICAPCFLFIDIDGTDGDDADDKDIDVFTVKMVYGSIAIG